MTLITHKIILCENIMLERKIIDPLYKNDYFFKVSMVCSLKTRRLF